MSCVSALTRIFRNICFIFFCFFSINKDFLQPAFNSILSLAISNKDSAALHPCESTKSSTALVQDLHLNKLFVVKKAVIVSLSIIIVSKKNVLELSAKLSLHKTNQGHSCPVCTSSNSVELYQVQCPLPKYCSELPYTAKMTKTESKKLITQFVWMLSYSDLFVKFSFSNTINLLLFVKLLNVLEYLLLRILIDLRISKISIPMYRAP